MAGKSRIGRKEAVEVCQKLGYHTAAKWNRKEMGARLKELVEDVTDEDLELEGPLGKVLERIVKAGGDVELYDEDREPVEVEEEEPDDLEDDEEPDDPDDEEPDDLEDDEEPDDLEDDEEPDDLEDDEEPDDPEEADEELIEVEEPEPKAKKTAKGKKPKAGNRQPKAKKTAKGKKPKAGNRPKIFGKYSAGPFVRWLGKRGVDFDGAREILESEGCGLKDNSIKMELKEKREGRDPADVSADDEKSLRKKYGKFFR